jgi:hypothetical protein
MKISFQQTVMFETNITLRQRQGREQTRKSVIESNHAQLFVQRRRGRSTLTLDSFAPVSGEYHKFRTAKARGRCFVLGLGSASPFRSTPRKTRRTRFLSERGCETPARPGAPLFQCRVACHSGCRIRSPILCAVPKDHVGESTT